MKKVNVTGRLSFKSFLLAVLVLFAAKLNAQIKLPALISDNMILQRGVNIPIWGWASVGEKIEITFHGKKYTTVTGTDKKWSAKLQSEDAGGPFSMIIKGNNTIKIKNILIGDVWLCSGQSNMALMLSQIPRIYDSEIMNSENPDIRQFGVARRFGLSGPLQQVSGEWKSAKPENVKSFSATAYFFAKKLYEKYKIPVGLINSSFGGTCAEAWMSEEALKEFPAYYAIVNKYSDEVKVQEIVNSDKAKLDNWLAKLNSADTYFNTLPDSITSSGWRSAVMPGSWESLGSGRFTGVVWLQKEFNLPSKLAGKKGFVQLGLIEDEDKTYLNGKLVGATGNKYDVRYYPFSEDLLKAGKNTILLRVLSYGGKGGFIRDKKFSLLIDGNELSLDGDWKYQITVKADARPSSTSFKNHPANLYHSMIAPVKNYGIKGVIWYQGESSAAKAHEYRTLFPALIQDWRKQFNQGDFPFLFVQLPNNGEAQKYPVEGNWAGLREAQTFALNLPRTGMVTTLDIGEWNDVHPANKKDVGERLAFAAQHVAYGEHKVVYCGPTFKSYSIKGNKAIITLNSIGGGLATRNAEPLGGFVIAAADKKFVWAHARIKGNKIEVWNDEVKHPVAVRYAWANNPVKANLINKEGFPAGSFRTDDWEEL